MQEIIVTTPEALEALFKKYSQKPVVPQTPSDTPAEIINEDTLCSRLDITHPTAGRWRKKGKIPFLQVGSAIRYNWPIVITALENKKSKG